MAKFKYLEVIRTKDNKVVKRLDVSSMGERGIDRVEGGMNINLNHKEYHTDTKESETALTTDDKELEKENNEKK